ncbi:MAG TPA: pyrroline-5-carboxylate reductase [Planctomycetota bacterium]|nr:pyrroline-5-carboxylate reductase [Planctomycetota bacterium]
MSSTPASTTVLSTHALGLIGAGNMAEALVRGVINSGAIPLNRIIASDISTERRAYFSEKLGVRATTENTEVVQNADLLVLCVKPQQVNDVLKSVASLFDPKKHLLASICAGVTTARLEAPLPAGARTVRVMPNTPMLVGLGASCLSAGKNASAADVAVIEALFSSASLTLRVEERMMDAVTGLSGSGPAYLFYLVEAMIDAGIAEGFTREQASQLASRTVLGAAKMLEETKLPPEELRRRVTSPNGTTQAAIERLDADQVKAKITAAVRRAAERSRELGK